MHLKWRVDDSRVLVTTFWHVNWKIKLVIDTISLISVLWDYVDFHTEYFRRWSCLHQRKIRHCIVLVGGCNGGYIVLHKSHDFFVLMLQMTKYPWENLIIPNVYHVTSSVSIIKVPSSGKCIPIRIMFCGTVRYAYFFSIAVKYTTSVNHFEKANQIIYQNI